MEQKKNYYGKYNNLLGWDKKYLPVNSFEGDGG